ncbi:uncharacterized protein LOC117111470 [Anneissia japonica]|uniref:uncharacterized protein LOC117111470 n=1 Tax=Anneissia japonica TaxID=1529436 RepID=UPI0014255D89|nr:uncharacterized protein LOC117111470 [Anneissia japonica]
MMIKSDEAILYKEDPTNYVDELQQIGVLTTRVLNKAQSIVDQEKLSGTSLVNNPEANYKTVTDKSTLNVITLKVLEEYYWYLVIAERDFDTMLYNHQVVSV